MLTASNDSSSKGSCMASPATQPIGARRATAGPVAGRGATRPGQHRGGGVQSDDLSVVRHGRGGQCQFPGAGGDVEHAGARLQPESGDGRSAASARRSRPS